MKRHVYGITIVLAIAFSACSDRRLAQRRPITETDLFSFVWVADPQIAPDGSRVAFLRVGVDEKRDQYETPIWMAETAGREPARASPAAARHRPTLVADGRRLAFVRAVEKDGRPQPPRSS